MNICLPSVIARLAFATLAIVLAASTAHGYAVSTHRAVSNVALRRPDCKVDQYLKDELVLPAGINTAGGSGTLAQRLEQGAEDEDNGSRATNHFYNPITNGGLADLWSGAPSLQWAYDHGGNQQDWRGARDAYHRSFTAASPAQRQVELGNAFYALGHVIHLVQDLGQPQHTRNDAHLTLFPGGPYEDYCKGRFGTPGAITGLGTFGIPVFGSTVVSPFPGIPGEFAGYWDTGQYIGQPGFAGFLGEPGLAEFSNAYFITDDTMFGTFRTGVLRRGSAPGLKVRLTESWGNNSTAAKHRFTHPSLFNTNLASFYPATTTSVTLEREGEDLSGAQHYVSLEVRDATGTVVHTLPALFLINGGGEIGFDATTYFGYAQQLLPRAVAYSAGLLNYFFRGRLEIQVRWLDADQKYRVTITNKSGETLGAGSWQLYQDDASDSRLPIPATFNYGGSLSNGSSFTGDFAATSRAGGYTLVFRGTVGNEQELAVVAKSFDIVRVHITWTPNSDQDLSMWGPDGSLIYWDNLVTQHGELDNDNIAGEGPENITLKDLQPGTYQFMINYYRDWWREQAMDANENCIVLNPPEIRPDDVGSFCHVQTDITVTMRTYHNSNTPVRTETRTMVEGDQGQGLPGPGASEGAVGQSWFVTQIVTVDQDRNVTVGGTVPNLIGGSSEGIGPTAAEEEARSAPAPAGFTPRRKPEGRRP